MITIAIDDNNDIYLDNSNNLALKKDIEAMGDIFINKSQTVKGELQYTDKGIDFFNTIFSSPCYPDLFQNELTSNLINTDNTRKIVSFEDKVENNTYDYKTEILTDFGNVTLYG